jgi:DNA modification methylase
LAKIKKPKTKLGDVIYLGHHKILCGSSLEKNNMKKLFGEEKASMIYNDSPYNINLSYDKGIGGNNNYGGNVEDNRTHSEYIKFLDESLESALSVSKKDLSVFY